MHKKQEHRLHQSAAARAKKNNYYSIQQTNILHTPDIFAFLENETKAVIAMNNKTTVEEEIGFSRELFPPPPKKIRTTFDLDLSLLLPGRARAS